MKLATVLTASALTLLAACAQPGHHKQQPRDNRAPAAAAAFDCDDIGLTAQVRRLNNDQIEIRIDNRTAVLSRASSASGERYTGSTGLWGHGGEWHQKGDTAVFSYTGLHGNQTEVVCRRTR